MLALAGCATTSGATSSTAPPAIYAASGPGASRYTTQPPSGSALRGPHAYRAAQGLEQAAASGVQLAPDPRLAEVGRLVAEHEAQHGGMAPAAAIDLWTRHLGLWEPAPKIALLKTGDPSALTQQAEEYAKHAARERATHVGAYTAEQGPAVVLVMVASERLAQLEPVPREIAVGGTLRLRGELAASLHDAQLITTYPNGTSERAQEARGNRFSFDLPMREQGEHRVEIVASSPSGIVVVANFPVYVGIPARTEVVAEAREGGTTSSAEAVRVKLLELLNAERKRAGIAPVAWLDSLAEVAMAHSIDMRDHDYVAHTSPTTGTPEQRLTRAGVRVSPVRENIGRDDSAEGIHRGLMESPGHRDNILGRDVTHVGIGVTEVHQGESRAFLATQVFARIPTRLDADDDRAAWLQTVAAQRDKQGRKPLSHDEAMSALCDAAARRYFGAPEISDRALLEQLTRSADATHPPYKRLTAIMTVVTSVEEAAALEPLSDPKARAVGIGLAQGTRASTVDDAIAVVVLVGY